MVVPSPSKPFIICKMATAKRNRTLEEDLKQLKSPQRRLCFINDELHKIIHIDRVNNIVRAYSYLEDKQVAYLYTDYKKRRTPAYSIALVSKMLNRHPSSIRKAILRGDVKKPYLMDQYVHGVYYFCQTDVYNLRDFFANWHTGRPRKDGYITPRYDVPTKKEIDALFGKTEMLYVKNKAGDFIPVWRAEDF
jgi:hypothetical protein